MALRLEIISHHAQQLGSRASLVVGVSGGSIGRALDNDWALPDTQRYLSGHHARIHFRQGGYYLEDTSTNGVYVNDSTSPQGRRGLYCLQQGDVLRMGEYRMKVYIEDESPLPVPGTHTMAGMAIDNVVPLRPPVVADDLGASLNIEALIPPDVTGPVAKLGLAGAAGAGHAATGPLSAQQRLTRLRAAARARLEGNAAPLVDVHNGMQAFCRGAGIDPERVPMESEAQSLHLAGRLLREALIGLKEVLRAQHDFRERYGIEHPRTEGRSPLDEGADEYLLTLLTGHDRHQLDAVMQLREHFTHAGDAASAPGPAMRQALGQFLAHLAPTRMEAGTAPADAAVSWGRYKDIYANLLQATGADMPHLFLEALGQAYREALARRRD